MSFISAFTCLRLRSDPGLTWTRFKPSMTASLNEDLKKQLYHDLTQGLEDMEDVTNDRNRQPPASLLLCVARSTELLTRGVSGHC